MLQVLFLRARRRREGDGLQARRSRFLGIFLTYRCIKQIRAQLFRKKQSILYTSFEYYPGGATDPFWEGHQALFFLRFRFRREHFLQLLDEMELSGKIFRCYTGKPGDNNRKYHNYPADLCIMVVLRCLSYPCTFQELVGIFGYPSNRIAEMYHAAIDFIALLRVWRCCVRSHRCYPSHS